MTFYQYRRHLCNTATGPRRTEAQIHRKRLSKTQESFRTLVDLARNSGSTSDHHLRLQPCNDKKYTSWNQGRVTPPNSAPMHLAQFLPQVSSPCRELKSTISSKVRWKQAANCQFIRRTTPCGTVVSRLFRHSDNDKKISCGTFKTLTIERRGYPMLSKLIKLDPSRALLQSIL